MAAQSDLQKELDRHASSGAFPGGRVGVKIEPGFGLDTKVGSRCRNVDLPAPADVGIDIYLADRTLLGTGVTFVYPGGEVADLDYLSVSVSILLGCALSVRDSGLSADASSRWLYIAESPPKTLYTVDDEKVTYWIRLDSNLYRGQFGKLRVDWVDPSGKVFLSNRVHTAYGTNDIVLATLPIRDNCPSRIPGRWKVEFHSGDRMLDQARFSIEDLGQREEKTQDEK